MLEADRKRNAEQRIAPLIEKQVKRFAVLAASLLVLTCPGYVLAQTHELPVHRHSHLHAPGETDEDHGPFVLDLAYTGEVNGVLSGGNKRSTRYLDNLDIVAEADLDGLIGWKGASALAYGLYNNGTNFSPLVGDAQVTSNIETGTRAFRLYEVWLNQEFGEHASLRVGLYDLNSEFDALDTSSLFIGSAHGIGTDISQSGVNGPSIFPTTSLAARIEFKPAPGWSFRAALLDGVPGDPDRPTRTAIKLGNGDGALFVAELEAPLADGKLLFGHWRYSAHFERFGGSIGKSFGGFYARGEHHLTHEADPEQGLSAFFRLGFADGRVNPFESFLSAGLRYRGLIEGRDRDEIGFALASAFTSRDYRLTSDAERAETALELTYRAHLAEWLTVQPDIQYIFNPGPTPGIPDALVFGLRVELGWRPFGAR